MPGIFQKIHKLHMPMFLSAAKPTDHGEESVVLLLVVVVVVGGPF